VNLDHHDRSGGGWGRIAKALWVVGLFLAVGASSQTVLAQDLSELIERPGRQNRQIFIPQSRLTNGANVQIAFSDVVGPAQRATVRVQADGDDVALGGVVGPEGWILTKASQLTGKITCTLANGKAYDAAIVGVSKKFDLAMLKITESDLPVVPWEREAKAAVGQWVATPGMDRTYPTTVGVVSVLERDLPPPSGILGVQLEEAGIGLRGARIGTVYAGSAAERGGLREGDVISRINGEELQSVDQVISAVKKFQPGATIELTVRRDDQDVTITATLTALDDVPSMQPTGGRGRPSRSDFQNSLGGELSQLRTGFPTILQHDSVLRPEDCGGPLVNLDGKVVGFNIARAGRVESYAIPTGAIMPLMYDLMSGNLAPTTVVSTEGDSEHNVSAASVTPAEAPSEGPAEGANGDDEN
jgi:serine protease Do